MKIAVKKQVEEFIDIQVPACFKQHGSYYKITEKGLTCVFETGIYTLSPEAVNFGEEAKKLMKCEEILEYQFNEKFATTIENIGLLAGISNVPTLQLQD